MLNIAKQIKTARINRNLSQAELCSLAGINYNTLLKIETGQITNPTISSIIAISRALEISLDQLTSEEKNDSIALGQVFTNQKVAQTMVQMVTENLHDQETILDPCVGKNVFLSELVKVKGNSKITGIEYDQDLITPEIREFYENQNRELIIGDFFDFDLSNKFDRIIMNPPYVRQEDLLGQINNKSRITNILKNIDIRVSSRSNLYVYFILKALKHLSKSGKLVAIVYDSWLYSDFGTEFKKLIAENYNLKKVIHYEQECFENVNVGATIVEICQLRKPTRKPLNTIYLNLKSPLSPANKHRFETINLLEFTSTSTNLLNTSSNFFITLDCVSRKPAKRGTSAIINKFFILEEKKFDSMVPIVKDVKRISTMTVDNSKYLYSPGQTLTKHEQKYLDLVKKNIFKERKKYRSIYKKIIADNIWYKPRLIEPGNIIFNYYFRKNTDHFLNPNNSYTADNFYNLYIPKNQLYLVFSILNSSLTKIILFDSSKPQGRGLRKIQLNKFKTLKLVDVNKLQPSTIRTLEKLGLELSHSSRSKAPYIVSRIDQLLLDEYNRYVGGTISSDQVNSYLLNRYEAKF